MLSKDKAQALIDFGILNGGAIHNLGEKTMWIDFINISGLSITKNEIRFNHLLNGKITGAFFKGDWGDSIIKLIDYKNSVNLIIQFKTNKKFKKD